MLHSTSNIIFLENPQIKPVFLEKTSVILTKDYTDSDPFCHNSFTKGSVGSIQKGSLSIYGYSSETRDYTNLLDNNEWYLIELTGPPFEESEGCVMPKDLRLLTEEDLEL